MFPIYYKNLPAGYTKNNLNKIGDIKFHKVFSFIYYCDDFIKNCADLYGLLLTITKKKITFHSF